MKGIALGLILMLPLPVVLDAPRKTPAAPATNDKGRQVFQQACAVCHMADGSGVPSMQPAIDGGNKVVMGDPQILIALLLKGAEGVLPADRERYANQMPAFDSLPDEDVAAVLSYIRSSFGNKAAAVAPKQVAAVRAKR